MKKVTMVIGCLLAVIFCAMVMGGCVPAMNNFSSIFNSCAEQLEPIPASRFRQEFTRCGFTVSKKDGDYSDFKGVESTLVAGIGEEWQIEHYTCADNKSAQALYNSCQEYLISCMGNVGSSQNIGTTNNMKFTMSSDFCGFIYIRDNCVMFVIASQSDYLLTVSPALRQNGYII